MTLEPPPPGSVDSGSAEDGLVAPTGRFRIYLGAAAGVGKTCAMLEEGRRRRERGRDVVIGFVETHGRLHTAECAGDLEVVPRLQVEYRGARFEEMDLDAVLRRRPQLALIDELAHTNVPGSGRHAKRWEDVLEILDTGISVVSTVNVQHLESLAESVEAMTATPIRERVPDWVVRRANQLELVDSSPEQLRRRMVHGNIYPADQVPAALTHFFSTHNLTVLRELALRFVADEAEEVLLQEDAAEGPAAATTLETEERILVAVAAHPAAGHLLHRAARMAARLKCQVEVLHVIPDDATRERDRGALAGLEQLAQDLGQRWQVELADDVPGALVRFARRHHITQLLVGAARQHGWHPGATTLQRILRGAGEAGLDVHVIALEPSPRPSGEAASKAAPRPPAEL